jgi:hypothetical protein
VNTQELMARLRRHYIPPKPMPGGVFLEECGFNGAFGASPRCDALYVGFTGASGRILVGHELKVSRQDWRNELDKAGKADAWADECHEWYIVAPDEDTVPREELPPAWGLMVPNPRAKTRMRVVKRAANYPGRVPSWDAVRSIMSRLDTLKREEIANEVAKRVGTERVRLEELYNQRTSGLTAKQQLDLELLAAIEQHVGPEVTLHGWGAEVLRLQPEQLVAAARVVVAGREAVLGYRSVPRAIAQLENTIGQLKELKQAVEEANRGQGQA